MSTNEKINAVISGIGDVLNKVPSKILAVGVVGLLTFLAFQKFGNPQSPGAPVKPLSALEKMAQDCTVRGYQSGDPAALKTEPAGAHTLIRFAEAPKAEISAVALVDGKRERLEYLWGVYGPQSMVIRNLSAPWPVLIGKDGKTTILMPDYKCGEVKKD